MSRTSARAIVLGASIVLAGCRGKVLATAQLSEPGTTEVRFTPGKKMQLWADYNGSWTGSGQAPIRFDVEVLQDGKSLTTLSCDAARAGRTKVCSTQMNVGNEHSGNCEVTLACELPPLGPGEVTLRVKGSIVEPARVKGLYNMSLNVRED